MTHHTPAPTGGLRRTAQSRCPPAGKSPGRGGSDATVTDLSTEGCFVLADEVAGEGDLVRLDLSPPGGEPLTLWGHVVHSFERTGFAVRFAPFSQGGALAKFKRLLLSSR